MSRDRSGDGVAPTQVSTSDATMRSDDSSRPLAAPEDMTLPAPDQASGDTGPRFAPGSKLGRYEIIGLLGRGGMGEVYAAYDPQLDRPVAVKVLLAEIKSEAASARLVREAQALARLSHPNVVAVYDAGEDRGHVYLAMQYVDGETLLTFLKAKPRTWQEIVALFTEAGKGLAAAHAAGMIHRDFKPSNVLVDKAGRVAVTDFGVARAAGDSGTAAASDVHEASLSASISERRARRSSGSSIDANLTRVGELVGTPVYMSAEQFSGGATTAATDQFAFCVALWEALFDRHPYLGAAFEPTPLGYASAVQEGPLILPERPMIPRWIITVLSRGLAREPTDRWPSMDALLRELSGASTRRRWPWIAAAAAVIAGGGIALALVSGDDEAGALCPKSPEPRLAAVWGPPQAAALSTAFGATGRDYAAKVAANVTTELDDFGKRWLDAVHTACTTGAAGGQARAAAARRLACLDRAHARFAATVVRLTTDVAPEIVDRTQEVLDGLPGISDCASDTTASPPPAIAARLATLEPRLAEAETRNRAGQARQAEALLAALTKDAADLHWESFDVRLANQLALNAGLRGRANFADLAAVGRRYTALGYHRSAMNVWTYSMTFAPDAAALDEAVASARAAAALLGGGRVSLEVDLAHARGLVRQRKWPQAASMCRDGMTVARGNGWTRAEETAADCLAEALTPLGKRTELMPILEWNIATKISRLGADHPTVADLLMVRAGMYEEEGKLVEAEATLSRVLEIRKRAYGERDLRVVDSMRELAGVVSTAGEMQRAVELATEALAIAESHTPVPDEVIYKIRRDLGGYAMAQGNHAEARKQMEQALAGAEGEFGPDSIEVGFLLLMYGQYQTAWDLDAGVATLRRSITIFEASKDKRVAMVRAALATMLLRHDRAAEALVLLEDSVAKVDTINTPPMLMGQLHHALADALVETRGDLAHAYDVASEAASYYAKAGALDLRQRMLEFIEDKHLDDANAKRKKSKRSSD